MDGPMDEVLDRYNEDQGTSPQADWAGVRRRLPCRVDPRCQRDLRLTPGRTGPRRGERRDDRCPRPAARSRPVADGPPATGCGGAHDPTRRASSPTALAVARGGHGHRASVWRTPVVPTDPWHYVRSALEFPSDDWVPLGYTRYGIILANILPALVFKNAQATLLLLGRCISSRILVASSTSSGAGGGGRSRGVVVGRGAAPRELGRLLNLTRGYPDIMSVSIIILAAYLALLARDRLVAGGRATSAPARGRVPARLGCRGPRDHAVRSGRLVAADPRGSRATTCCARGDSWRLPVLAWAAVDVGISGVVYGDPLLKLHTLTGSVVRRRRSRPAVPVEADDRRSRLDYFLTIPQDRPAAGRRRAVDGGRRVRWRCSRSWCGTGRYG